MLQPNCSHSTALPANFCSFCNCTAPDKLLDICFEYIIGHLETICENEACSENFKLRRSVALPVEICERLLNTRLNKGPRLNPAFVSIFENLQATKLKRVRLRNTDIDDDSLRVLLQHRLTDLEISYSPKLSFITLHNISTYSESLVSLTLGENTELIPPDSFLKTPRLYPYETNFDDQVIVAPSLRRLTIKNLHSRLPGFYRMLLQPFEKLTHLDLSNCDDLSNLEYTDYLTNLTTLILYDVSGVESMIPSICKLKNLRHLDISQSKEHNGIFENSNQVLATIVENLSRLMSLDISGTNLAGTGVAEPTNNPFAYATDIPGLSSRVHNPFQFLGLYETQHDACLRHDIPAKLIAGNASEEQILVAAMAYMDRSEMLQKVLNELFHLFRFETCAYVGQALNVVLEAMNKHLSERHIQISGSATLFYIVKGAGKELHEVVAVKRRIIKTLLNGMCEHRNDDTMMRNGCLTLCQFKIPYDVVFDYERLVDILLHSVYGMQQESFVQRIGIYLLNSLACQVDGHQKVKLGELGGINKMLWLISERLDRGLCDDVLEVAWSTMWNVTDETPANCKKFLENKGMTYFIRCLEQFQDKEELLRNMMGLLGNVAEVHSLRHYLMTPEYISVFSDLLDSISDGIEVSYNAAGVISHIASDGPEAWTIAEPSRKYVLDRMTAAINRWDINSQRNINYRSFEPILYLVKIYETPECQQWAVWALANLTKVYPNKYCALVESEGGLVLLQELIEHHQPPYCVKQLASTVIENCRQYREKGFIDFDSQLEC